jgi:hypothetical protein
VGIAHPWSRGSSRRRGSTRAGVETRQTLRLRPGACSVDLFAQERQHVFGFGIAPEHRFREEQCTVEVHVEDAARPGNDLDSVDRLLPLLEDAHDQTGRVGQRASGNAVLDPDTMSRGHRSILVS